MNWKAQAAAATILFIIVVTGPTIYKYYAWLEYGLVGLGALIGLTILLGFSYLATRMILDVAERLQGLKRGQAETLLIEATAIAKLQTVTQIKPGHEAVITYIQHPQLPAMAQSRRFIAPPLPGKIESIAHLPSASHEDDSIKRDPDWIRQTLFDEYGQLKVFHAKTDGPTGVGKTYLMLHMIWLLQQPHPAAEYWLSDPKFEGKESGWPFEPFVTDFDQAAEGAEFLYQNIVTARKHAKREGNPPKYPAFLLFDEADGCFEEHGDKFTKPVRRIVKEGRSGWTHCFVAGQSPLVKDNGFSGSLFRNTARFILGNEALSFTQNGQFTFFDKGHRDKLARQLSHLQENNKRYALVIPPSGQGLPFVGEIPKLDKPSFINLRPSSGMAKVQSEEEKAWAGKLTAIKSAYDGVVADMAAGKLINGKAIKLNRATILRRAFGEGGDGGEQYGWIDKALAELGISL